MLGKAIDGIIKSGKAVDTMKNAIKDDPAYWLGVTADEICRIALK